VKRIPKRLEHGVASARASMRLARSRPLSARMSARPASPRRPSLPFVSPIRGRPPKPSLNTTFRMSSAQPQPTASTSTGAWPPSSLSDAVAGLGERGPATAPPAATHRSLAQAYTRFLIHNAPTIASAESAVRSATYLLPGRFEGAEIASEGGASASRWGSAGPPTGYRRPAGPSRLPPLASAHRR
jgi:hypothetical protein